MLTTLALCADYDCAYDDLLSASSTMIDLHWYELYCLHLQANPENIFYVIMFDKERQRRILQLNKNVTIQFVPNVKSFGVNMDVLLTLILSHFIYCRITV